MFLQYSHRVCVEDMHAAFCSAANCQMAVAAHGGWFAVHQRAPLSRFRSISPLGGSGPHPTATAAITNHHGAHQLKGGLHS